MPNLILLRHGESQWNLENRFTGWTGIEPAGEPEATVSVTSTTRSVTANFTATTPDFTLNLPATVNVEAGFQSSFMLPQLATIAKLYSLGLFLLRK